MSSVTTMKEMFNRAESYNQTLNNWDVSNVSDMDAMFNRAYSFNQDLNSWDVTNVTNMSTMFEGAADFNGNISNWNTGNVTQMAVMFWGASSFNQPIGNWDISNVTSIYSMFMGATIFNQPIGNWDISSVNSLHAMFYEATSFNQPIGNWDTSNVVGMNDMFTNASSFDQTLADWNISSIINMANIFDNSGLSTENYDNILISWSQQSLNGGVPFGAVGIYYCNAEDERQSMIDNNSWNIIDEGENPLCDTDQDDPPVITSEGEGIYCPQTQQNIVTNFNIEDPDSTTLDALYIQISEGYVPGEDQLIYNGSDPNLNISWNVADGKLEISSLTGNDIPIADIITAVYEVVFFF